MWPIDYSQVWRAEHGQSARERRAADEQLGRLAADLSHSWLAAAKLVSALVAETVRLRRRRLRRRQQSGASAPLSGAAPLVLGSPGNDPAALSLVAAKPSKGQKTGR